MNQTNSGVATQNKLGVAMNTPFTGMQIPSMMASTNPIANVSPTVVSNQTKKDQVTDMANTVNQLAQSRGMTSDGVTTKFADGTIAQDNYQEPTLPQGVSPIYGSVNGVGNRVIGFNTPVGGGGSNVPTYFDSNTSTPAETPEEKQFNDILNSMKASTDATTASTIASIQQKAAVLKQQQQRINEQQQARTQNALLTGGVTGQGSSAQFAPISSENIIASQMSYGVSKLAELDAQEQDLINQARVAGDTQNFRLMEKSLDLVEKKRVEKAKVAQELNKRIEKENEKAREASIQATRDNALADLITQGITEPNELLLYLNENGGDFTLKEVNDGLKNISKTIGFDDPKNLTVEAREFYRLKEAGEIPQSILELPTEAEQMNAYLQGKAIAKKAPTNPKAPTTTKPLVSGGLTYTKQDISEDKSILEASRGADHFVDPTIYQELYNRWIGAGGLLADFLATYPPKTYVNPANTWLPVFLVPQGTKAKASGTTINDL